jgi:hypothetical protein
MSNQRTTRASMRLVAAFAAALTLHAQAGLAAPTAYFATRILTCDGAPVDRGVLLVRDGKIAQGLLDSGLLDSGVLDSARAV